MYLYTQGGWIFWEADNELDVHWEVLGNSMGRHEETEKLSSISLCQGTMVTGDLARGPGTGQAFQSCPELRQRYKASLLSWRSVAGY